MKTALRLLPLFLAFALAMSACATQIPEPAPEFEFDFGGGEGCSEGDLLGHSTGYADNYGLYELYRSWD